MKKKSLVLVLSCLASMSITGCASIVTQAEVTNYGKLDPARERQLEERFREREVELAAYEVMIFQETLPDGIEVSDGSLKVTEGSRHRILSRFVIQRDTRTFFPKYRDTWRKPYCYPQNVLVVATLMTWALLPVYYPCYGRWHYDKEFLVGEVERLVRLAGGNAASVEFIGVEEEVAMGVRGVILELVEPSKPSAPKLQGAQARGDFAVSFPE